MVRIYLLNSILCIAVGLGSVEAGAEEYLLLPPPVRKDDCTSKLSPAPESDFKKIEQWILKRASKPLTKWSYLSLAINAFDSKNVSDIVWFGEGQERFGIYRRVSPSLYEGDVLEIFYPHSGRRQLLKSYAPGTTIEAFNLSPDGGKLLVILLGAEFHQVAGYLMGDSTNVVEMNKPQRIEQKSDDEAVSVEAEVLDLVSGESSERLSLGKPVTRGSFRMNGVAKARALRIPVMTENMAVISSANLHFADMEQVLLFEQTPSSSPRFVARISSPFGADFRGKIGRIVRSKSGRYIAGTVTIAKGGAGYPSPARYGVFVRDLHKDPLSLDAWMDRPLFRLDHQVISSERWDGFGPRTQYVFSPDEQSLLVYGGESHAAIVGDLHKKKRSIQKVQGLDSREHITSAAFFADGKQIVLAGSVNLEKTIIDPKHGFYNIYDAESFQPKFGTSFIAEQWDVSRIFDSPDGQHIVAISKVPDTVYFLGALRGEVLGEHTFDMGPDEFIADLWFSHDSQTLHVVTNLQNSFSAPLPTQSPAQLLKLSR